jgi:hypothetical protein
MSLPWRDKGAVKTCTTIEVGLRDGTICLQAPWTHFGITYDSGTSEGYIVLTIPWKLLSSATLVADEVNDVAYTIDRASRRY